MHGVVDQRDGTVYRTARSSKREAPVVDGGRIQRLREDRHDRLRKSGAVCGIDRIGGGHAGAGAAPTPATTTATPSAAAPYTQHGYQQTRIQK